jgi:hypothetical protein
MKFTSGQLVGWGFGLAFGHAKIENVKDDKQIMATIIFWKWRWNLEF